jgi:hypothetical protein
MGMTRKRGSETIETPQWIAKKRSVTRTKYNVEKETAKRTYKGVVYDSAMEMRYFIEVVEPLMVQGIVVKSERQVRYTLMESFRRNGKFIKPIEYIADYVLTYANGIQEIIDVKGKPDAVAKLKRKLFWNIYPDIEYRWMTYNKSYGGWVDYDELQILKRAAKKAKGKEKKLKMGGTQ